jgi:hypothetical protein
LLLEPYRPLASMLPLMPCRPMAGSVLLTLCRPIVQLIPASAHLLFNLDRPIIDRAISAAGIFVTANVVSANGVFGTVDAVSADSAGHVCWPICWPLYRYTRGGQRVIHFCIRVGR